MNKYVIEMSIRFVQQETIEAETEEKALDKAVEMFDNGEIKIDFDYLSDVTYECISENKN